MFGMHLIPPNVQKGASSDKEHSKESVHHLKFQGRSLCWFLSWKYQSDTEVEKEVKGLTAPHRCPGISLDAILDVALRLSAFLDKEHISVEQTM